MFGTHCHVFSHYVFSGCTWVFLRTRTVLFQFSFSVRFCSVCSKLFLLTWSPPSCPDDFSPGTYPGLLLLRGSLSLHWWLQPTSLFPSTIPHLLFLSLFPKQIQLPVPMHHFLPPLCSFPISIHHSEHLLCASSGRCSKSKALWFHDLLVNITALVWCRPCLESLLSDSNDLSPLFPHLQEVRVTIPISKGYCES